MDRWG
jgi:hypothetical protein